VDIHHADSFSGLFNPFVGAELAWDLGHGWGFAYLLGAYFDITTPWWHMIPARLISGSG
jgi:hypothetical protein